MSHTARQRAAALTAATPTATLVTSLTVLESLSDRSSEQRTVRAWIIDELEDRFPEAKAAVDAAFEADEALLDAGIDTPGVDYVSVLLTNITPGKAAR